jgi:hypothetical protein
VCAKANRQDTRLKGSRKGKVEQRQKIVMLKSVEGLDNKGHIVAKEDLFTTTKFVSNVTF